MTDRMDAVDHTHPAQDGVANTYRRGRHGDDGLRADGSGDDEGSDTEAARMRDVSHKPADGDGTNRVWARGETGKTDQPVRDDDE